MTMEIGDNLLAALCILIAPAVLIFVVWRTTR